MGKYKVEDFTYEGKYKKYCWDINYNPNATIENGLANCTTMAIAFSYILQTPYPVSRIASASNWHNLLINGWKSKPYGSTQLKVGDIIEWSDRVHVATVIEMKEGEPYLGCSWYTGEHGVSVYNGRYDTRPFSSLKELSDFMYQNYPYRMYHECSLYEESNRVGGMPERVLSAPIYFPVGENKNNNQIETLTNEQYVRDENFKVVGVARKGFYNVIGHKENNYTWYEIEPNRFVALVNGRVRYIPADNEVEILRSKLERIKKIIEE